MNVPLNVCVHSVRSMASLILPLSGALVGIVLSGLYKHFVTDQIMDGGNGMENPDQNLFLLDGDGTYVDNSLLWPVLEGTWEGENGRWQAVIGEKSGIVLRADGETVLTSPLHYESP